MRRRKSSQFCSTSNFKLSSKFSFSFLPLVDFLLLQFPITQFYLQIFKPILDSAWKLKSPHKNTEVLLQYTKECSWVLVTLVHSGHCKYIAVCTILFCVLCSVLRGRQAQSEGNTSGFTTFYSAEEREQLAERGAQPHEWSLASRVAWGEKTYPWVHIRMKTTGQEIETDRQESVWCVFKESAKISLRNGGKTTKFESAFRSCSATNSKRAMVWKWTNAE